MLFPPSLCGTTGAPTRTGRLRSRTATATRIAAHPKPRLFAGEHCNLEWLASIVTACRPAAYLSVERLAADRAFGHRIGKTLRRRLGAYHCGEFGFRFFRRKGRLRRQPDKKPMDQTRVRAPRGVCRRRSDAARRRLLLHWVLPGHGERSVRKNENLPVADDTAHAQEGARPGKQGEARPGQMDDASHRPEAKEPWQNLRYRRSAVCARPHIRGTKNVAKDAFPCRNRTANAVRYRTQKGLPEVP
jgi:hypothetical protein